MGYMALFYVCCFKCSLNIRAIALIFELNQAVYSTFKEFKYECSSPPNEFEFEKINISCFYLHFTNFNLRAKVCSISLYTRGNQLHIWNPRPILFVNYQFVFPRLQKKQLKIKCQQKS